MNREITPALKYHKWFSALLIVILLLVILIVSLISAGLFDPKPIGELITSRTLNPVVIDEQSDFTTWFDEELPNGDFTVRVTAAWLKGDLDTGFGLALGSPDNGVIVALSALGYLSMWQERETVSEDQQKIIIPWQTWPHIQGEDESNEIWIDVRHNQISTVRINRELFQVEPIPLEGRSAGLWARSFAGPSEIDFIELQVYGLDE